MTGWLRRRSDDSESAEQAEQFEKLHAQLAALLGAVAEVQKQIERLGKEQYKTNLLLESSRTTPDRSGLTERLAALRQPTNPVTPMRLLEALMPLLDSIEAGMTSGTAQLAHLDDERAYETLRGWLEGQRLLRDRLLSILEREDVRPIPTVGQAFDPYRHVAAAILYDPGQQAGTIVEERRRGFEVEGRVLRFAEVVVTTDQPR